MSAAIEQRNQDATVYVGNLDDLVTEELLWELMLQAGAVINVHMPRDKVSNTHQNYGFVEFRTEECAEYALQIMNMVQLYGKPMRVKKASQDKKTLDIGANLFVGNLDPEVDEKLLYDTFSAFGGLIETPKIMRDVDSKASRGFGFLAFDSFEAADLAIECMHGQYLCNRQVVVQFAYKKDSNNERHGSAAERLLAQTNPHALRPHTRFGFGSGPENTMGIQNNSTNGYAGSSNGTLFAPPPPPPPPSSMPMHMHMNMHMGMNMHGSGGGYMNQQQPPPMHMMAPPPPPPPPMPMGAYHQQQQQQQPMGMQQPMQMMMHQVPPPPPPPPGRY